MNIQEIRKQYPQYDDMSDQALADAMHSKYYPDIPKEDVYQKLGMNWENIGGQVIDPTPDEELKGKLSESFPGSIDKASENAWDRIGAHVQAGYRGTMMLGSNLAKLADKLGLAPEGTAKSAQSAYEEAEKIYQQGKYPETAVSSFVGEILPTLPLAAPISAGAKLGGALLGTAGKYLGSAAGGAVSGGVTAGLLNQPGQSPEDVFDEQSAMTGTALGAALGPAGQFLSRYGKGVADYQSGKEALRESGYKGPVLARDFGDESVAKFKSTWMDNLVDTNVRNEQLAAITPAIKNVLGGILKKTEQQSANTIGRTIRGINKHLENQSSKQWDDLFLNAKEQGISKIDTINSKQTASNILSEYSGNLSKKDRELLTQLSGAKQVDFKVLNRVKGSDIWKMSEKYGKKEGTVFEDVSDSLKNLYWDITDDIGNTLSNKPGLKEQFEQTKAFTSGVKDIFNVKNNRQLVNAVSDVNEKSGQLKTFINSVIKPVSGKSSEYYNKALGPHYQKSVSDLVFRKSFEDSLDLATGNLNLNKFFKTVETANDSKLLNNTTVQALGGLEKYFQKIGTAKLAASQSNTATQMRRAMPLVQTGAVVTAGATGGVADAGLTALAVFGAPKLLSYMSKASLAKNLLIGVSKVYGKNPKTTEYLMNKVGQYLTNAGVIISESPDGIVLDLKQTKQGDK